MSDLPLDGLTVVEIATFVAGPSAGLTMAQLGAEVIRIDPLGGAIDYTRWPVTEDGTSLYWHSLNRGKRSVAIDLRSDAGRDVVRRLITAPGPDRGILVDNQPNADWLAWPTLSASRADLIHVHIEGHRDGRPAVDYTINAETGVPLITGPESSDEPVSSALPVNHVLPAWDLLCGLSAVTALLAALRRRDRTGEGGRVDIALADIALASAANLGWYSEAARGIERTPIGNAIYGSYGSSFATRDARHVMVVALTAHQWRALLEVTGTAQAMAALEADHAVDFARDEAARYEHRAALGDLLGPWFAAHDADEVATALSGARALWAPYRTLTEAAARGEGPLTVLDQPGLGAVISATLPQRWQGVDTANRPASQLGADTTKILRELAGLDNSEIAALVADGVIGSEQ